MVAIKWPDAEKAARYDSLLVTNQDIIPIVFSYLSESETPLKHCPDDLFTGFRTPIRSALGFNKGKILP